MRDNLHRFVIGDPNFPENVEAALRDGFAAADRTFLEECIRNNTLEDISGTCASVCLFVEDQIYVANVGDSRSVLSTNGGINIESLTTDHKPNGRSEKARILAANGKIYK